MQTPNLIIFPGAGDPACDLYQKVYDCLRHLAKQHGYLSVDDSVRWPGHASFGGSSSLNFHSSVVVATKLVLKLEESGRNYDLLARSFGCFVALSALDQIQIKHCKKVILWGPPPLWKLWELFVREIGENVKKGEQKLVTIDGTLFPSFIPMEILLRTCKVPTTVVYGTADRLAPHHLVSVIDELRSKNRFVEIPRTVDGADHEVTLAASSEVIESYGLALFGAKS